MFFSLLALGMAISGYMIGNPWVIVGAIAVGIIAVRKTVYSFNKLGTLVNFIILIVAIGLGVLSIPEDENDRREVAKVSTPKISNERPTISAPVVKPAPAPTVKTTQPLTFSSVSIPEPNTGEPNRAHMSQLECAHANQFDRVIFGKDGVESLYLKFCRGATNSIRIHYTHEVSRYMTGVVWIGNKNYSNFEVEIKLIPKEKGEEIPFFTITPDETLFTTGKGKGFDYVVYHLIAERG